MAFITHSGVALFVEIIQRFTCTKNHDSTLKEADFLLGKKKKRYF
jgi:hypothetical protein